MEAGVARMGPWAGLSRAGGIAGAWNRDAEGRGGRDRADDTAAAAARGDERKAGASGLIMSFWNASFAWNKTHTHKQCKYSVPTAHFYMREKVNPATGNTVASHRSLLPAA